MMHLAGIFLVIFSCSGVGIARSLSVGRRCHLLRGWMQLVLVMRHEITMQESLPVICRRLERKAPQELRGFCGEIAKSLEQSDGGTLAELFDKMGDESLSGSALEKEDISYIASIGTILGMTDRKLQTAFLERYERELERRIEGLEHRLPEKQKLYRSLGILCGIFLGVLLL